MAWRATIGMDALEGHLALDRTSLLLAPGYHAVCYPLPHRKMINVALFARQKPTDAPGTQPVLPPAAAPIRSVRCHHGGRRRHLGLLAARDRRDAPLASKAASA